LLIDDLPYTAGDAAMTRTEPFGAIRPATAMVEVRALISSDMLVAIEADAVIA